MSSIVNIHKALTQAKTDDQVGISIAPLSSGRDFCLFSAEIKKGNKGEYQKTRISQEIWDNNALPEKSHLLGKPLW